MRTISVLTIAICVIALSFTGQILAQDTKVEVYEKIHIPKKKPIPYPYTREADVMWSKVLWRMIDLREKMNLPLFYPTKPIGERMNFISLLFYGIDNEGLQVYNPVGSNDEFKIPMSKEDIEANMGNQNKTIKVPNADGTERDTTIAGERKFDEVKKILIKEKWFFDKNYSTMQVRIVGLCPIRVYPREVKGAAVTSDDNAEMLLKPIFWVYYPEARNLFSSHPIFNKFNDAQQASFDDLFMQRRFSGYIYAESNVYDNRLVQQYTTGMENLLEGERIKESLFNIEHDLWEY
jgi:gliding motility associated protien GldN